VFQDDFLVMTISIVMFYFFMNNAYWVLAGRYMLVVRGNRYVMQHKPIPQDMIRNGFGFFFFMMGLNSLVPIAYGIYLYQEGLNPYRGMLMTEKQFSWFLGFNILNCSVQLADGLILIVCIFIARVQLSKYGFRIGLADNRIIAMAIGSMLYVLSSVLVVISYNSLYNNA
jgi:hypothetical protein